MAAQVKRWQRIHEVFHPTDASPGSDAALRHALRICLFAEARLTLMRVNQEAAPPDDDFPDPRAMAARWQPSETGVDWSSELQLRWLVARGADPVRACLQSLERNPADLIVVATHQRDGRATWLGQCVAEPLVRSAGEMTLLIPDGSAGFVRADDGAVTLKNILIPVASHPRPEPAIEAARRFMLHLPSAGGTATLLHVGDPSGMPKVDLPELPGWKWNRIAAAGDVVETIRATAARIDADLVAMTTQGRHGFLDALRGSTTERVLREARFPMLTMPVDSFLG